MAKAITFIPLGSIAFRVNLFSAIFACLTLAVLFLSGKKVIEICFPESDPESRVVPALFSPALLAFSFPFWYNSVVAEVYTLHAFFTCLIIYFLLFWKANNDVRFLFFAAFCFGLSAGNHATVAFYLPAILVVFFLWEKKEKLKNLGLSALLFLMGFSVYLYLPIRSMTEPIMDWGNPETFQNFFDQVTDRRHAELHFSSLDGDAIQASSSQIQLLGSSILSVVSKAGFVITQLIGDLAQQFTWVMVVGFIGGAVLCARKNLPVFIFLFLFSAVNASFFAGWRAESYFPSYIVACLWASIFFYWILNEKLNFSNKKIEEPDALKNNQLKKTARFSIVSILCACAFWLMITNYLKVDRSDSYFAETLLKKELLSLDDESILITEVSWFNMAYHMDVSRLRDDVVLVKAGDFLEPDPTSYFTSRRYPQLNLSDPNNYQIDSREPAYKYMMEFLRNNVRDRPVIIEQNWVLFKEFPLAEELLPYKNLLLKFPSDITKSDTSVSSMKGFYEFKEWLEEELNKPGLERETKWIYKIIYYLPSFANHFHAKKMFKEEREVLVVMHDFLGHGGADWHLKMVDNLILDGKLVEAWKKWEDMIKIAPSAFETFLAKGLLLSKEGERKKALQAFESAIESNPEKFRPYFELAETLMVSGDTEKARLAVKQARTRITSLGELMQVRKQTERLRSF